MSCVRAMCPMVARRADSERPPLRWERGPLRGRSDVGLGHGVVVGLSAGVVPARIGLTVGRGLLGGAVDDLGAARPVALVGDLDDAGLHALAFDLRAAEEASRLVLAV